jgi:hypothetical protein
MLVTISTDTLVILGRVCHGGITPRFTIIKTLHTPPSQCPLHLFQWLCRFNKSPRQMQQCSIRGEQSTLDDTTQPTTLKRLSLVITFTILHKSTQHCLSRTNFYVSATMTKKKKRQP